MSANQGIEVVGKAEGVEVDTMAFRGDEALGAAEAESVDILGQTVGVSEYALSVDELIVCVALRTSTFKNIVHASFHIQIAKIVPDMVPLVADTACGLISSKGLAVGSHRHAQSSDLHETRTAFLASPEEVVLNAVCSVEDAAG